MAKESNEVKPIKIKAELMWAYLDKVNDMSGKYQVDLTNLSPQAVEALEEVGIEAKRSEKAPEKGFFITVKSNYPIKALDTEGDVLDARIGNGTLATAVIGAYSWTFKNKKGVSPSIKKLVITKVVEYVAEDVEADDEEAL